MLEMEFGDLQEKIIKECEKNKLEIDFEYSKFPIVAILRPNLEERDQLRFELGDSDERTNFVNGEIRLVFADELTMTVLNDFNIEDGLLNKIKNQVKKLHYIYLQIYFKNKMKI